MYHMNKDRLLRLADNLYSVPSEKFNLIGWRNRGFGDKHDSYIDLEEESLIPYQDASLLNMDCGTTGCAIGWACAMPSFIKEGLVWNRIQPVYDAPESEGGRTFEGWDAVSEFFGIDYYAARHLFSAESYRASNLNTDDPIVVAKRIEMFVRDSE
jgi:hypothetical protein